MDGNAPQINGVMPQSNPPANSTVLVIEMRLILISVPDKSHP
ncbi:hypothetical protein CCP3SC5AM1_230032 [Gammaproteobacteria bacterium]